MIKTGQQNNTAGPVEYTAVADERWLPRNNFYVSSPSTTDQCDVSLWSKKEKNTDKIAIQSFTVPRARDWAVRANERTDERVAQYFSLYSWLFSTNATFAYITTF